MAKRHSWGELPLASISVRRIEAYLAHFQDAGRSTATFNRNLATIKTLLKTAQRWGYLGHNPASAVTMLKELKRPPNGLHDPELQRLLDQLDGERRALTAFMADTGLRCSEMEMLTWGDVHLDEGYLLAGRKNYEVRTVPLSARVVELLREREPGEVKAAVWTLTGNALRKVLRQAGPAAGLGHVHPHMLRHTFATRLLDHGVPLNDVQALMGHKTPMMTQRYDHVHPDRLRRAIHALAAE